MPILRSRGFVCPYCFEKGSLDAVAFRCDSDPRWCPQTPDAVLESFWNRPSTPMGRAFPANDEEFKRARRFGGFLREAMCPMCTRPTRNRICPICHEKLNPYTGDCHTLVIGVIGAKEAGKSHYITSLIHELRSTGADYLKRRLRAANDHTMHRFDREFYGYVFGRRQTIPATVSARVNREVRMPLTYYLRLMGTKWWGRILRRFGVRVNDDAVLRDITLSFFDTAGEDLNAEDTMRIENRYIYNSHGLVLLLDPLQLPPVRERLQGRIPLPAQNAETRDIIHRTANLICAACGIPKGDGRIPVPIALAFSKSDAIASLIPKDHPALSSPYYENRYDLRQHAVVQEAAANLLSEWGAGDLLDALKADFSTYGLFFVSSLGCTPDNTGRIPNLQPHRVLDPFLWLLAKNRVISIIE
jgi:hypothetical protein